MSVAWSLVLLFAAAIACDVIGQLCFKIGSGRLPAHDGPDRALFVKGLLTDGWLLAGVLAYAVQLFVWVSILATMPLSVAFPIASLTFLGVAFACRIFLAERLDSRQYAGVALVVAGVAIVAGAA